MLAHRLLRSLVINPTLFEDVVFKDIPRAPSHVHYYGKSDLYTNNTAKAQKQGILAPKR